LSHSFRNGSFIGKRKVRNPTDLGTFANQNINVGRWILKQFLEKMRVPSVSSNIARVQDSFAINLNKQAVTIEGRVIDANGRDRERTEVYCFPISVHLWLYVPQRWKACEEGTCLNDPTR